MNKVWYETSTDNGSSWILSNNMKPLSEFDSKLPAIDSYGTYVVIVWQEKNGSSWEINLKSFSNGFSVVESIVDANPFTNYTYNTYPTVAWAYGGKIVVAYNDEDNGIQYKVGYLTASSITWYGFGTIAESTEGSIRSSIAARDNYHSPVDFHIAWETQFSSSKHLEYQRIRVQSNGSASINSSDYKEFSTYSYGTHYGPFNENDHVNLDVDDYGAVQFVWVAHSSWDYYKIMRRKKESYGVWGSSFYYYDYYYNLYSPNVRYASDEGYVLTWGKSNSSPIKYWNSSGQTIISTNVNGQHAQLVASESSTHVKAIAFNSTSLPYEFNTSNDVLTKEGEQSDKTLNYRTAHLVGDHYSINFELGNIKYGEKSISFTVLNDTTRVSNNEVMSNNIKTESFALTENKKLKFETDIKIDGIEEFDRQFKNNTLVEFQVQLVEAVNGNILGNFSKTAVNKNFNSDDNKMSFTIGCEGYENRVVFLRLILNTDSKYYLTVSESYLSEGEEIAKEMRVEEIKESLQQIKEYKLTQNYPNPFNPTTTIYYDLPEETNVTIKVYDLLGEEVAELVHEQKPAGSYSVQFDGKNLSSGVYVYTLSTNKFHASKKMLLIK